MSLTVGLVSDLHLEMHRDGGGKFLASLRPLSERCDVLVAAGDIAVGDGISGALKMLCSMFKEVVYVTGNHEVYGTTREHVRGMVMRACQQHKNLHWLRPGFTTTIAGQRFLGGTLWFPWHPTAPKRALNDFKLIRDFEMWVYEENRETVDFLARDVQEDDIVVTHHLPSYRCVSPEYVGSPLNPFFVCEMDEVILRRKPKLWLFGHTHSSIDATIGSTRVASNPLGYPHQLNLDFDPDKSFDF